MKLVSVVLSGGAGTRLWPASRQAYPKPFMKIGGSPLLAQAILRGQACGTDELLVITNHDHLFLTKAVIDHLPDPPHAHFLLEPNGRNTGPAIAMAALHCAAVHGPAAVMFVLPADHLIPDTRAFVACAMEAAQFAQQGQLVVFGIHPSGPDTGFGYIEVEHVARESQRVLRFVEKPDLPTAQEYLATGRYYWNSGMFCFTAATILDALARHAPHALEAARHAFDARVTAGEATRFDTHLFGLQPNISIDYAVMEKADNVTVVPARFGWSDVGSWPAVAQAHTPDASGNTFDADVVDIDTQGTHVQVESHGPKVVATVGVKDLVVVDTPDALLVAHKDSAQKIKSVVEALKARGHDSTHLPAAVQRPWGTYATLKEETGYKVKRITVKPGESLSLQFHYQRSEHWVVVQGTALIQVGDKETRAEPGQYRFIGIKEKHRLSNIGTEELVVIEVQCGDYLGEDDIVRLADTYGRA
ncbi:MAG: mannose-phosphate guanylyltransferase/mannose-6-phosphate isomerase [Ramlibacter sp.]|jgi:mannose-1-phosphate guanylyltransferase|nr:mannose-phosphate guanylyltransferase/mannose-6-phosphate isomerase [Ramlibacter sp.]